MRTIIKFIGGCYDGREVDSKDPFPAPCSGDVPTILARTANGTVGEKCMVKWPNPDGDYKLIPHYYMVTESARHAGVWTIVLTNVPDGISDAD